VVVRGSAWRAAIWTSRSGTPSIEGGHDKRSPEHVRVYESDLCPFADRADPAVGGTPVEALTVVTDQNRSFSPFTDGEVDGSRGARHQRDQGGLVALPDDPQYPVASLEGHVLDVGFAGFADSESVQAEQYGQGCVGMVEAFGGEEEPAELAAVQSAPLGRMDLRTANVLGWVGGDPPVYVGEAVKPQALERRRSIVEAARPRSSIEARYSSRWARVASSTARP
jgi:hypothetical protein